MRHDQLTVHQIVDAFREEALSLGVREEKKIKRSLLPIRKAVIEISDYDCDDATKVIALKFLRFNTEHFNPTLHRKAKYLPMLKKIIALAKLPPEEAPKQAVEAHNIEQAKQIPIESLYTFEKVKRAGRRIYACCPFHNESSPSFFIDQRNVFHCFGCSANGSAIDFYMKLNGCSFLEAVKQLGGL